MEILRFATIDGVVGVGVRGEDGLLRDLSGVTEGGGLAELLRLRRADLRARLEAALAATTPAWVVDAPVRALAPVDGRTEVWAAGVTYHRSREARMEESQVADVYDLVYDAARPELFLKAVAWRVMGDGDPIGVREDSQVDVPEPELALVVNAHGEIVGLTICNDVSSRSIEGANPLYLPQAKIYAGSCALGPAIRPVWEVDPAALEIAVAVERDGATVLAGTTTTASLHRGLDDLVEHLFRADHFPDGVVLATGTGIVPDLDFTLDEGDMVRVSIGGLGTLTNPVVRGKARFAGFTQP